MCTHITGFAYPINMAIQSFSGLEAPLRRGSTRALQIQGGNFASTLPAIPVQKKIAGQLPTTLPSTSVLWQLWQTPVCRQSV